MGHQRPAGVGVRMGVSKDTGHLPCVSLTSYIMHDGAGPWGQPKEAVYLIPSLVTLRLLLSPQHSQTLLLASGGA